MKKISAILCLLFAGTLFANSVNDLCVSFSTKGPDRYADGSTVLDGECYALVWSKDGVFEGFKANGECADTNDVVVLVAPVARDGRCPAVLFQVPKDDVDVLKGGHYAVYLLDTRVSSGEAVAKPRGVSDGGLELVNGYGAVTASLSFDTNSNLNPAKELEGTSAGQTASDVSAAPSDCPQPKVKNMRVEGDNVYLTVENLRGHMRVQSGKDVKASESTGAAVETSGATDEVILVAPKSGSSGFYKVIRN